MAWYRSSFTLLFYSCICVLVQSSRIVYFSLIQTNCFRFGVLTAVNMRSTVFSAVIPCNLETSRRFGGTYDLHLNAKISAKQETNRSVWKAQLTTGFLFGLLLDPEVTGGMFIRNVVLFPDYTALQSREPCFESKLCYHSVVSVCELYS
jgi:hypothetical protein